MISHQHKCIFIHIPKCAGTSVENVLGHFDGHEGRSGQDHRSIRMIQQPGLQPAVFKGQENTKDYIRRVREGFRSHANPNNGLTLTRAQYETYYKFTFVRNPWQRAHSWYKNVMRDPIHQKNYGIDPKLTFTQFMKKFAGTGFLRPQTYWLKDFKGNIPMDFIGKFETLASDFNQISAQMGLGNVELPHKIEGQKSDSSKDFTKESIEFIAHFYREEIELFNYSYE
ncbi:sulfotransferase family 2 domain-containing protein [Paraglaciecola chathamensis]|uniref:sulfotransferase family 2 domain-containing protein n=1 Tax=Paraglaciecola chathamensis TaxID=368405 RepID=UPI00271062D4|nr:sulfotransferase family 2 domain-containing protein [Paraglaciecola chathamensis]MDO6838798.1 sulfotransferase family 2 domain-containing protein [Paraglaciecola chathamensis]